MSASRTARLVANPGCYTTCAQLPLLPLIKAKAIDVDEIVVDAKSGMTGAGRAARENMLFSEVSEGFHAYGVGHHRHMAELDQEFSAAAGREVIVSFTPHLVPMNRGILSTIYVRGLDGRSPQDLHAILSKAYGGEPFVHVLPFGEMPQTRHVRGSNMTFIGVAADRIASRAIIGSALDNLVKGAAGQAVQNMNLVLGFPGDDGAGAGRAVPVSSAGLRCSLSRLRGRVREGALSNRHPRSIGGRQTFIASRGLREPEVPPPRPSPASGRGSQRRGADCLSSAPSRSSPARPRSA